MEAGCEALSGCRRRVAGWDYEVCRQGSGTSNTPSHPTFCSSVLGSEGSLIGSSWDDYSLTSRPPPKVNRLPLKPLPDLPPPLPPLPLLPPPPPPPLPRSQRRSTSPVSLWQNSKYSPRKSCPISSPSLLSLLSSTPADRRRRNTFTLLLAPTLTPILTPLLPPEFPRPQHRRTPSPKRSNPPSETSGPTSPTTPSPSNKSSKRVRRR